MSKIKHIFLDLDDTIFDFHKSEGVALSGMLQELGIEPTQETVDTYSKINRACWESLERGETTREKILTERFRLLFERLKNDADPFKAQRIYEGNLAREYHYVNGAEELISSLLGNYKLYQKRTKLIARYNKLSAVAQRGEDVGVNAGRCAQII